MNEFIDIQVNGYAGVDFLGSLANEEQMRHVAAKLRAGGVRAILFTTTTADHKFMIDRIAHYRKLIDADPELRKLMPAFHFEGPCLSPEEGYKGAHPAQHMKPASREVMEPIIEAAGGFARTALVTLAPEVDKDLKTTRWLVENGVVVAVGHTNASLDILREAEQAGASLFTHLGNGCHHLVDRHDNVLNRALSLEKLKYSLIADGHHLPWFLLKTWVKFLGVERCVFTTDCVTPADAPPGRYKIMEYDVEVGPNKRVQPAGKPHLAGSALTMREAYQNAIDKLGLSVAQARALCIDNPLKLVGKWIPSR